MTPFLYPIRFQPIFQYRMWGGDKLQKKLSKTVTEPSIGESWELSAVDEAETAVSEGPLKGEKLSTLVSRYQANLVGRKVWEQFGEEFPLLIKFIDAKEPLSVQVHPNDAWAQKHHNSFGKNEMWYILQADPNAELILGFEESISAEDYQEALASGALEALLHKEKVKAGDAFFIPTGRVHAIGAGVLLAEIQQTSDVTYRIYDYNRVDAKTGKTRILHTQMAQSVADFSAAESYGALYQKKINYHNKLINTPYFSTHYLPLEGRVQRNYQSLDSFVVLIVVEGFCELIYQNKTFSLKRGEVLLIPASLDPISLQANKARLLEVYMP